MRFRTAVMSLSVAALVTVVGTASDKKVQMKDLPPAVRTAVESETKGAVVKALIKEVEDGKTFYEVETTVNGKTRDLLFDASGSLAEVEEELAVDAAPAAVRTGLSSRGTVLKLESVTKGSVITYEAQVEKNGKKSAVALDASGKPVKG